MSENIIHTDIKIISIHISCTLRLVRLKKKLSQHDLGISSGIGSTNVGRIERAEHDSSWSKIFLICQILGVEFKKLFIVKSEQELLSIVEECYSLETKLNQDKKKYYDNLRKQIKELFSEK